MNQRLPVDKDARDLIDKDAAVSAPEPETTLTRDAAVSALNNIDKYPGTLLASGTLLPAPSAVSALAFLLELFCTLLCASAHTLLPLLSLLRSS